MNDYTKTFENLGIKIPEILFPKKNIDLQKWAVIACDQFTSDKKYWKEVRDITEDSPSTLKLIFPEAYLNDSDSEKRIKEIKENMKDYISQNLLENIGKNFVLIKRETPFSPDRHGLLIALDLEHYDFNKGSTSLIRATEGTIIDRIPPRLKIRKGASLELPHIMVLINDPKKTVIEPLIKNTENLEKLYDINLMLGSGKIEGYKINKDNDLSQIAESIEKLADKKNFKDSYNSEDLLLFAVGDGNHSLATAKTMWEEIKNENINDPEIMEHPARWALIELLNIYDEGILFEAIHRVVFNIDTEDFLSQAQKAGFSINLLRNLDSIEDLMSQNKGIHKIGFVHEKGAGYLELKNPQANIPAGSLEKFLDNYAKNNSEAEVDYIHGKDNTIKLGSEKNNIGLILPVLNKNEFFDTVIKDGALPRKTFSMGEDKEKRFYIEARKILKD